MNVRLGTSDDLPFLEAMLFEAFFWNPVSQRPPFTLFRRDPEFVKLLANWGRQGDRAVIAETDGVRLGAAWFRLWTPDNHSYGFVDAATPELGIAVDPMHRERGVGRALMHALITTARADRHPALSLSVSPDNPARSLYESLGFTKVGASGTSWTFCLPFD